VFGTLCGRDRHLEELVDHERDSGCDLDRCVGVRGSEVCYVSSVTELAFP